MPKEAQELLKDQELIGGNDDPKFLGKSEVKKMVRSVEINKYDFMNDGIWIKYSKNKDFFFFYCPKNFFFALNNHSINDNVFTVVF